MNWPGSEPPRQLRTSTAAIRTVAIYVIVAIAWITLSDLAVDALFSDPAHMVRANLIKGWLFVGVTGVLLYALITRLVHQINQLVHQRQELSRRQQSELEEKVAQRTAELQGANQELDSFAYAVSHDLRAPLRAMNGFSEALLEDHRAELSEPARAHLDQIRIASSRMQGLIDGLLALSRVTRGALERSEVNLSEIVKQSLHVLQERDPHRQVEVGIEPDLIAEGDPRMLAAALDNLADNAWKYSVGAVPAIIRFHAARLDGEPAFCISDNGAGFDMRHIDGLFKPFQRLHRQDEFPGLGIGLATVQRIIHRHGGRITAEARPGQGARFLFTTGSRS
ncbi:MAG: hypothetical protein EA419_04460 [Wenzhouxiangella sp.]|nr:MAG: hypothetical protein EA419_04460 [Wenzhouxiangella sp.]